MITIIVSSVNDALNREFRRNIQQTIGVEYELLCHDNRQTNWGLCKLYNHYAAQSRYELLCFLHEDLVFHTQNWGRELLRFFDSHPEAGVVGFAGSTIKTEHVSGWGSGIPASREHLIQHFPDGTSATLYDNPNQEEYSAVVPIDGLALITTKQVWSEHPFDEHTFSRFHLYDLDFTMQVAQHYTNYVCHMIDVEHLSNGSFSSEWLIESDKFIAKWRDKLPCYIHPSTPEFIHLCQHYDAYRAVRLRLSYSPEKLSMRQIFNLFLSVNTFPYKFRLIRHIWKAKMRRTQK